MAGEVLELAVPRAFKLRRPNEHPETSVSE